MLAILKTEQIYTRGAIEQLDHEEVVTLERIVKDTEEASIYFESLQQDLIENKTTDEYNLMIVPVTQVMINRNKIVVTPPKAV
jgi:hypothetical protein